MDLSVIIVSWNVREKLKNNLAALFLSQGQVSFEVFVVDNNSADQSAAMVKKDFSQVNLIANEQNLGFARANNQAIKRSVGRYILLLNPDMKVFPDTLSNLVKWLDSHGEAMVTGAKLIDEAGSIVKQVRRFPKIGDQLAIVLKLPHLLPKVLDKYIIADFNYEQEQKVDSIRGSFFAIRREAIGKIGFLDERYFVWFEEVDYCRRVSLAGGEVWYTPTVKCVDYVGQSFKQLPGGRSQKYFRNSMLAYFKKWQPSWQYWLLYLVWPIGIFLAYIDAIFNCKSKVRT